MFDLLSDRIQPPPSSIGDSHGAAWAPPAHSYHGPERRQRHGSPLGWVTAALDEIDYGLLLLDHQHRLIHANHEANMLLNDSYPLRLDGRNLRTRDGRDAAELNAAIQGAAVRGLRKLVSLGVEPDTFSVSVVPLRTLGEACAPSHPTVSNHAVLLMLGKRNAGGGLALESFARANGLSPTELRVLKALCEGKPPSEVAGHHGVAMSTMRTQIGNIRTKTGASSIRDLLRRVAELPPLQGILRR